MYINPGVSGEGMLQQQPPNLCGFTQPQFISSPCSLEIPTSQVLPQAGFPPPLQKRKEKERNGVLAPKTSSQESPHFP